MKNLVRRFLCRFASAAWVGCALLISSALAAEASEALGEGASPLVQAVDSDLDQLVVRVEIPGLRADPVERPEGRFIELGLDGYGLTTDVGVPALPVIREFVAVPWGAEPRVRLLDAEYREVLLDDLRVLPRQYPVEKNDQPDTTRPLVLEEAAYTQSGWTLNREIAFRVEGVLRNYRVGLLEIFPVNYAPREGRIRILTKARVEIRFDGADPVRCRAEADRYATPTYNRLGSRLFLNGAGYVGALARAGAGVGKGTGYLVIAHTGFASSQALSDFADAREAQGFEVTVVDSATAGGTKQAIKNYITTAVDTWPVPPEYVLLVGDTGFISHWVGSGYGSPDTDLNYALVRGSDYFPDVFIGRFSVTNQAHLSNLVNKILAMESHTLKDAVFMASTDNYTISEGTHNYVISKYLNPDGWNSEKLYTKTYNAKTYQVTNAMNDGRNLAVFSGHGSTTSWADGPSFTQSNVKALTNTIYPVIMSFACLTGDYTYSECFAETWIRDDHGGVLFWGASVSSYWDEDDVLEKRVFEGWHDQDLTRFAEMGDYGKLKLYQYLGGGGTARRYYEMYNIMGDPAQKITGDGDLGTFTVFGTGIASSQYGTPTLDGQGSLVPGGLGFKIDLASVRPLAPGLIFISAANSGGLPFKGGFLYPFPILIDLPITVNASGELTLPGLVPPDYPGGAFIYLQAFFNDSTGPMDLTATAGLELGIP